MTERPQDLFSGLYQADELGAVTVSVSAARTGGQRDHISVGGGASVLTVAQDHPEGCNSGREPETVGGFTGLFYVRTHRFAEELACQSIRILVAELDVAELAGDVIRPCALITAAA